MFVHTVFFWLVDDIDEERLASFEKGLAGLLEISTSKGGWCGRPAGTPRAVVDNSYGYGLTVLFDDVNGHDVYQDCQEHLDFIAEFKDLWQRVQVYDYVSD